MRQENLVGESIAFITYGYMALVKQGGSRPFVELIRNAVLHSPFDEECLKNISQTAKKWLEGFDLFGFPVCTAFVAIEQNSNHEE